MGEMKYVGVWLKCVGGVDAVCRYRKTRLLIHTLWLIA